MSKYADEMHLCGQLNKLCNKQIILNILEENTRLEGKVIHESRFDNIADSILKAFKPNEEANKIDEGKHLLTELRKHYLFELDLDSNEPKASLAILMDIWGRVNNYLQIETTKRSDK